jgi:uncharacterized protein (DUF58 family)
MIGRRSTVALVLALLALLGGLATGRDLLFNLAYLFALLLIVSFVWSWININWLHLSRVTRTRRAQVGEPLEERFTVRNTSIVPKLWLEVHDYSSVPGHRASHVINNLGSRGSFSWRTTTICTERGRYQLGPLDLATGDPFGFFPMRRKLAATSNVVIYPLTVDVHDFALPVGLLPGGDALRRRTHYVTTNAAGVRDYAPGDSFGRIHWPSTARRDRLIVKEFELDPMADIWIIPDMATYVHFRTGRGAPEASSSNLPLWMRTRDRVFQLPESTEEYVVTIAASLARYFLRHDRAVGLLTYGQTHEHVQPDRGERQLNRILETLAVLRAMGQISISDMMHAEAQMLPRGSTVIVISPTTREEWVTTARQQMQRGLRMVTVIVDPETFGGPKSGAALVNLLRASGVFTYLVQNGDNLTQILSTTPGRLR